MPRTQAEAAPKNVPPMKNKRVNAKAVKPEQRKRVAPAVIRQESDATDIAETSSVATMREVKGEPVLELNEPKLVEPVASISKEKLEMLAFMREKVTVHIQDVDDPQADPHFIIAVNGRKQRFSRGQEFTVPRYVVEGLARAKPVGYRNEEYVKADGTRDVRWPAKRGVRYPFSVVNDPSGDRGRQWLRDVLKQP